MKLRGFLALIIICVGLVLADPVQRFVISPWVKLRPARRIPVLARWINLMAWFVTRPVGVIGGAKLPRPERVVPSGPGVLILMNHQSLLDIPLVVQAVAGGYPRIVTRKRYNRFIPLISHMTRLYQYPVVDPTANAKALRRSVSELTDAARDSEVAIAMFPEGTRTRDGKIGRFKPGLARILSARAWTVHVLVADGFWRVAKLKDFVGGMSTIRGSIEHVATLEWPDPEADPKPFVDEVRTLMVARLAEMRERKAVT